MRDCLKRFNLLPPPAGSGVLEAATPWTAGQVGR
jgi:hypothetical protein